MSTSVDRPALRDLPLTSRLVIAAFLISAGIGYFSALVQLHFQGGTRAGELLPGPKEAVNQYHGPTEKPVSTLERLLETTEGPFNGSGTMRPAFFEKSDQWKTRTKRLDADALAKLKEEREGERLALLDWVQQGCPREAYEKDAFAPQNEARTRPLTADFLVVDEDKKPVEPRQIRIKELIEQRCATCHCPDGRDDHAKNYPLDSYDKLKPYLQVKATGGMSLPKLAQTTHVHLLGFAMLYGLTGLIFSFTSYPGWLRVLIAPLALVAQIVDISCWWMARVDPLFAHVILVTGGIVAVSLLIQIVGSLFDLFGKGGKLVLVLLLVAAAGGGYVLKDRVIDPYLRQERAEAGANGP
jgi:hypothetical protein